MTAEDRKDNLARFDTANTPVQDTEPATTDKDKPHTDEDYLQAAALAHRPAAM
ncbi:hypothetical protein [Azospirillum halopraeferens]|uniref:hypothetical protein n=1 Tax=Azospirillum halopraeferens TaxID=34010 RepID=UPI0004173291|nr:hypothetical protein [Azospirillum halopraeferens]